MKENVKIEDLNVMELLKLIYEELNNKFNYLNEKIDKVNEELNNKFNYLNEKIDNTKNILVTEISEELKDFSVMTGKSISELEKKVDNEIEDRKVEICKIKDFNRIILNDIRGRVSILEEESEKYNLN